MTEARQKLANFMVGKTISLLRFGDPDDGNDFDIVFSDGSELELYILNGALVWAFETEGGDDVR